MPDFLVIGAMKCGTSTVCAYLEDHPDIFMVPGREPNFFNLDENFARGVAWYEDLFAEAGSARLCGEGSNRYSNAARYPETAARIAGLYPDIRLIYVVRHPLTRIRSAWVQKRSQGGDSIPPSLDLAVTQMPEDFVDQSLYWRNLARYRAVLPDSQIFVGFLEDMQRDRQAFFTDLCGFLQIEPVAEIKRGHQNRSKGKKLQTETYTRVNQLPLMKRIKKVLPKSLKSEVKDRFLTRPVEDLPEFSAETLARILPEIRADADQFLAHMGKPGDFWSLEP